MEMIYTTTPTIEGSPIREYKGIVSSEIILGTTCKDDFHASWDALFGDRSESYEEVMAQGRQEALDDIGRQAEELGANAIVGIDIDYETIGPHNTMMMVAVTGTAVVI